MKYNYDCCVIGGGKAGLAAAKSAKEKGKRVVLIEQSRLGGLYLNRGCIPTKTLARSAHVASLLNNLADYGLTHSGKLAIETTQVIDHVRSVVDECEEACSVEALQALGIDVRIGKASFEDIHTVRIRDENITAERFILCTGSCPLVPPVDGIESVGYLTSDTFFEQSILPDSLIILGAGSTGIEYASALNNLGVKVTVLEISDRILPREDEEVANKLAGIVFDEGIVIRTCMRALSVIKNDKRGVTVMCLDEKNNEHSFSAEKLMVATGRGPYVEGLELERVGVLFSEQGIQVNNYLQTSQYTIYAAGDVTGSSFFSPTAECQARYAVRNAFALCFRKKVRCSAVSWVTFSFPELASLGLMEQEARAVYGRNVVVYRYSYGDCVDASRADRCERGCIKVICTRRGYLIGASILGARAGELIPLLQMAQHFCIPLSEMHSMMYAYPSYFQVFSRLADDVYKKRVAGTLWRRCIDCILCRR